VDVPVHANEDFLDEILGLFPVADRAIYEVQQSRLVALDEFLEGTRRRSLVVAPGSEAFLIAISAIVVMPPWSCRRYDRS
jgi:hypothetical protein